MLHPLRIVLILTSALVFAACTSDEQELLRRPIDKADLNGSCSGFCGGPSDGNCWCDELCSRIGDCCGDFGQVCSIGPDGGPAQETDCSNGADDDLDGLIDCADPSCQFPMGPCGTPDAAVLPAENCTNGVDDDLDGLVDCGDPSCQFPMGPCGTPDAGVSPTDAAPVGVPDAAP